MALVPKDVRTDRDFQLVKGVQEMIRTSLPMNDPAANSFLQGEVVSVNTAGEVIKCAGGVGTPDVNARICWTLYVPADTRNGQTDAIGTKTVDVLSGPFQFKMTSALYVEQLGTAAGDLLFAHVDTGVGKLYNKAQGALAGIELNPGVAVARVISYVGGILWAESLQ